MLFKRNGHRSHDLRCSRCGFSERFLGEKGFSRTISGVASVSAYLHRVFYYSFCEPAMSHVYSYFLFCVFIWSVHRLFAQPDPLRFMVSSLFGLIVLVRPSNGLVLFSVPFVVGGRTSGYPHETKRVSAVRVWFCPLCWGVTNSVYDVRTSGR